MITSTSSTAWTELAPCAGVDEYLPGESLLRNPQQLLDACTPLLEECASCPFIERCYDRVRPASNRFDGVCAARLWVNGKAVASAKGVAPLPKLTTHAGTCGTSSGVKAHRRLGEPLCGDCRVTAQRADVRRAGAASIRKRAARGRALAAAA
ncbi:hypothetical protein AB0I84_10485 [Streptomyces spectabilis]|uniref:hypothetical protein n=1 Tax=Streptomyces spectabilis TaxID=68270 RepID=UPI0033DAAA0C